jgi:hypothetical protein
MWIWEQSVRVRPVSPNDETIQRERRCRRAHVGAGSGLSTAPRGQNVASRDDFRCQYCGLKLPLRELTYDHLVPRALGGKTCWENIVMATRATGARAIAVRNKSACDSASCRSSPRGCRRWRSGSTPRAACPRPG